MLSPLTAIRFRGPSIPKTHEAMGVSTHANMHRRKYKHIHKDETETYNSTDSDRNTQTSAHTNPQADNKMACWQFNVTIHDIHIYPGDC